MVINQEKTLEKVAEEKAIARKSILTVALLLNEGNRLDEFISAINEIKEIRNEIELNANTMSIDEIEQKLRIVDRHLDSLTFDFLNFKQEIDINKLCSNLANIKGKEAVLNDSSGYSVLESEQIAGFIL